MNSCVASRVVWAGMLALSVVLSACTDRTRPTAPVGVTDAANTAHEALQAFATREGEREFADISEEVPSFGGHFFGTNGNLVVWVADSSEFGRARATMSRRVGSDRYFQGARVRHPSIEIRKAAYSYRQLSLWRDMVSEKVLGRIQGAISSDMDEVHNTVTIGVLPGALAGVRSEIERVLVADGVPADAIRLINQSPLRKSTMPPASLDTFADTLMGGLRFWYWNGSAWPGCTIGYPATYNSSGHVGFVTAAHCSANQWATNDSSHATVSLMRQTGSATDIGYELHDPLPGTCPTLWPCDVYRYSDASIYRVTGHPVRVGWLLKPSSRVSGGSSNIAVGSTDPYMYVVGTTSSVTANSTIDHIGATTGWSYGSVTETCVDYWPSFTIHNDLIRCVYKSSANADDGDSGGPVFYYKTSNNTAVAAGIVFAQDGTDMWFSKWSYVESELVGGPVGFLNITANITLDGDFNVNGSVDDFIQDPILDWDALSSNLPNTTTTYTVYRKVWSASNQSFIDAGNVWGGTVTGFTDSTVPYSMATYMGTTKPSDSENYVMYKISAANTGLTRESAFVYFQQSP